MPRVPTARKSRAYSRSQTDAGIVSRSYTGGAVPTSVSLRVKTGGDVRPLSERQPDWHSEVPDGTVASTSLPVSVDLKQFVSGGPLYGWTFDDAVPPGVHATLQNGVVTIYSVEGSVVYSGSVSVSAHGATATSNEFTWTIDVLAPPVWSAIPDVDFDDTALPETYDVSGYASTSVLVPVTGYTIDSGGEAGITIDDAGLISISGAVDPGDYTCAVTATNEEGSTESDPFTITVNDTPL